ncbi:hypothetical protein KDN34_03005 [Shewanella yunxiaonensis]|uniref:Uncharacterized protein n=1 Tax=Shewanella yunxiaonensis TaxID=2829809 RepID=A0ABX7YUL8_9GAMM|nr:hypothetical protein [Shewanella yunxiaonensis]QUN06448.1 hypothetical protein KDN34_03005 [Shewanella yunxiaonensis]
MALINTSNSYRTHNNTCSAVNKSEFSGAQERRIQNPVYRDCAMTGFKNRLAAELAGNVPPEPPLYSHHATRQSYFNKGWNAVTKLHILRAQAELLAQEKAQQEAMHG